MRLLVILEFHFIKYKGKVYTDVTADYNFWSRYLSVFENITVCARMYDADDSFDPSKYLLSSRDNVEFVPLPEFKGVKGVIKSYLKTKKVIQGLLKRCDCVIFRVPSPISLMAYPQIKKSKKPFAVELMMNPYTAYSKKAFNHPFQPIIQFFTTKQTKKICMTANGVSYVTEHTLQESFPCKAHNLKEDQLSYFTGTYSTITLREDDFSYKKWDEKTSSDSITIVHSGKMDNYRKGHVIFLNVIKKLHDYGKNVEAIIIGDGPKKREFEQLAVKLEISEKVAFKGWLSGFDAVKKELRKGDIFLFPTVGEGLPRSVIEAMANGLICVSSPVDGVLELLDTRFLTDFNDVEGFARIINDLIENPKEMQEISKENSDKTRKFHERILNENRKKFYLKLRKVANQ